MIETVEILRLLCRSRFIQYHLEIFADLEWEESISSNEIVWSTSTYGRCVISISDQ